MTQRFAFDIHAKDGRARTGVISTPRGDIRTPAFMPVGTAATVKAMMPESVRATGADILLGNTYHLMLRPGAETVSALGGLGAFAGWKGLTLTDSGGFQVFSLNPDVDDDGVTFKSTYDGSRHRYTPESAVHTQQLLGADIQMVLDVCPPLPSPAHVVRLALERTSSWAQRAVATHTRTDQSLFGIVQGGIDVHLRAESAARTAELNFDGYGIGGLSVGESREEMLPALEAALTHLPLDRPRYLMGVGDPASLVEAVHLGVDQFDCVLQTRLGRHGTALTSQGRVNLKRSEYTLNSEPIDSTCSCAVCARHTRGYIRHLFQVGEPTASRLVSIHNIAWTLSLMDQMRNAIIAGRFEALRQEILAVWGTAA